MYKTNDMKAARNEAHKLFDVQKKDDQKKPFLSDFKHLVATCFDYWNEYILKDPTFDVLRLADNTPATEATFRFKYRQYGTVTFWLCGTIDKIGKFHNGCYAVGDYKTTNAWDNKGYFKSYELSVQLRFYVYAIKWMFRHYPESILGRIGATTVGTFIDAVFLKDKLVEQKYVRSEVFRYSDAHMDEFKGMLDMSLDRLGQNIMDVEAGKLSRPPMEGIISGFCEQKYGKCQFWNVCNAGTNGDLLLQRDFDVKEFNPLKYNE
jgi:hypothetical protein